MFRRSLSFRGVVGLLVLGALALAQLPGCGGGSAGTQAPTGTLRVGLIDAQSDAFAKVVIAIREVRAVPAGLEDAADDDARLPVVVSYPTPHLVDVLTLRYQQELLGSIPVPPGSYRQIRLILEPNPAGQGAEPVNYLTLQGAPTVKIPLKTPSAQQSGLKVLGSFQVQAGVICAILLDFDPNTAIVDRGNGLYNMKPTGIRIVQPATPLANNGFGSLSGRVVSTFKDWSSATVSVVPQGSSNPIAAGVVFSNLSSNRWEAPYLVFAPQGSYRVHLSSKGFAPYSSPVRTVTTGSDTPLGDILLSAP